MAEVAVFNSILYDKHTNMVVKMDASHEHTLPSHLRQSVVVKLDLCVKRSNHLQLLDQNGIPWSIQSTQPAILTQLYEFRISSALASLNNILSSVTLIPRDFLNATVIQISNYVLKSYNPRAGVIHIKADLSVRNITATVQRPPIHLLLARRSMVRVDDSMVVDYDLPTRQERHRLSMGDLKAKYGILESEDGDCSICLEELSSSDVLKFPCCHVFHCKCIFKWFQESNSCPLCRSVIS